REMRDVARALAHALGDDPPHTDDPNLLRRIPCRRGSSYWAIGASARRLVRCGCAALLAQVRFEIAPQNSTVGPGALDAREIDARFACATADRRRCEHATAARRMRGAAVPRGRLRPGCRLAGALCGLCLKYDELRSHRHFLRRLTPYRHDAPGNRRGHLHGRLLGHHLDERIVLRDRVARLHAPGDDLRIDGALAEIRQFENVAAHGVLARRWLTTPP